MPSPTYATERTSDRWVTPGVVVAGIFTLGLVVLGIAAGLVWLTSQGIDPGPVLDSITRVVGSVGTLAVLALQLATRQTTAKAERNSGAAANEAATAADTAAQLAQYLAEAGRHSYPTTADTSYALPPVPPNGTAPAGQGG